MKKYILLFLCLRLIVLVAAQQSVGINTIIPHPNASLDVSGINKGLLIPRGDVATRNVLNSNTAKGLMMYDTMTNLIWVHNGNGLATGWQSLSVGTNHWSLNGATGTEIANTNSGGFWSANSSEVTVNPGPLSPPVSGAGTRMMWIPQKSALRIGTVNNTNWDADSIGTWSMGLGYNVKAKGIFSTALGVHTTASGLTSTAFGYSTKASGENSISMGSVTTASGANTTSLGFKTYARSYGSVSIGRFNDRIATSDSTAWVPADPLLILGNGTSDASLHNTFVVYKNGNIISKSPTTILENPGVLPLPVSGPGTRMMWLPEKSAFRVGTVSDTSWNATQIGLFSIACGVTAKATGNNSISLGTFTKASGDWSVAIGAGTISSGEGSTAMGNSTKALGNWSTAMGYTTIASGHSSVAGGASTSATGSYSTAFGVVSKALGEGSMASNFWTIAKGFGSTVIGMYNDSILTTNQTAVNSTTPLFIIGNGDGIAPGERHNAMMVRKDGRIGIGTNVPVTLMHVNAGASASDGFLVQGDYNASAAVPDLNGGHRMTFFPAKGAFRAGRVTGTQWNNSNTGSNSTGLGFNTIASGLYSFAAGDGAVASSQNTFAAGYETKASGTFSLAMGYRNKAAGSVSNVMGYYNIAKGFSSTVVGMYNDSILGYDQGIIEPTTPLFIIGNGDGDGVGQRHNAMVIRKDGNVGIGTNSPFSLIDIHANSIGQSEGFMVRGDYYSGASTINMGAGNRMTFYPGKGVFRAGGVSGTQWDDDNAGEYSVAMGLNSKASGAYSVAIGPNAVATGMSSYALGSSSHASGSEAIAFGVLTKAKGVRSSSFGWTTISKSYAEVAIGQYNDTLLVTAPNSGVWELNDALLVGGNGTGNGTRSNAFVFYKNGNADINGYTQLGKTSEAAPSIKMKKLTGVSNIAQNAWTNIPHGLTKSKILSVDILVSIAGWVNLPPGYTHDPGYEYQYHIADAYIVVINTNGNSGNMLNKPISILITYEE